MVSKGEAQRRHLDPGGGFTHKHDRRGPNGHSHLGPTKTATHLARSRLVRIGVVRFEKSLVANLSAKRQLSVANLSTKRKFSLAKRDFLVANGRMAADFSSPGWSLKQGSRNRLIFPSSVEQLQMLWYAHVRSTQRSFASIWCKRWPRAVVFSQTCAVVAVLTVNVGSKQRFFLAFGR